MAGTLLTDTEIDALLAEHPAWRRDGDALRRELRFGDFVEAFGAMAQIALVAEKLFHHPEWSNVWATVDVRVTDHEAGGISSNDRDFVEAVDALPAVRAAR